MEQPNQKPELPQVPNTPEIHPDMPKNPTIPAQPEVQPLKEPMPDIPQEVPQPNTGHGPH